MATFQERFKGKTTVMGRNGLESVLNTCQQPIKKDYIAQQRQNQPLQQQVNIQYQEKKVITAPQTTLYTYNPYLPEQAIQDSLQYLSQQQYFQPISQYQLQQVNCKKSIQQSVQEPIKKQEQRSQSAKPQEEPQRYKPYTIKDYEIMKKTANTKLGGLGPNLSGEEWCKEREKQIKRQEFAEQVRQFNSTNIITVKSKESKQLEPTARMKALEFAKNIPKPQKRPNQQQGSQPSQQIQQPINDTRRDPFEDEIARLEREHLKYLNQLDNLK